MENDKKFKTFNGKFGSEHYRNMGQMLHSGDYIEFQEKNIFQKRYIIFTPHFRGGSRTTATSKIDLFVIIVNGF